MKCFKFALRFLFIIGACQKDEFDTQIDENDSKQKRSMPIDDGMMVLGERLPNPYSIENMTQAYRNVDSLGLAQIGELQPTHLYIRFTPNSPDDMEVLNNDTLLSLYEYPLDYEIVQEGEYYHDPSVPNDHFTYQYAVVPVGYKSDLPFEILSELYFPSEQEDAVEEEALIISGDLEVDGSDEPLTERRRKYNPQGKILVEDDIFGTDQPLRNVQVRIRRGFKIRNVRTNDNGYFRTATRYRGKVRFKVIFRSSKCKLRSTLINIWGTARRHLGKDKSLYKVICRENRNFSTNPLPNGFGSLKKDKVWAWATVFNCVEEYHDYCDALNIGKPQDKVRIWVNRNTRYNVNNNSMVGAAPMFHRGNVAYGINLDNWWAYVVDGLFMDVTNNLMFVFHYFLPDVVLSYGSENINSADISEVTYHELGHASHYEKVGSTFWTRLINYTATNTGYGDGTGTDYEICAISEAWGFHIGWYLSGLKYGNNASLPPNMVEDFVPLERGTVDGMDWDHGNKACWIPAGLMYDLWDHNVDNVQGSYYEEADHWTNAQFFNALDSDVDSPQEFRDRLLEENSYREQGDVEYLFESYYFN